MNILLLNNIIEESKKYYYISLICSGLLFLLALSDNISLVKSPIIEVEVSINIGIWALFIISILLQYITYKQLYENYIEIFENIDEISVSWFPISRKEKEIKKNTFFLPTYICFISMAILDYEYFKSLFGLSDSIFVFIYIFVFFMHTNCYRIAIQVIARYKYYEENLRKGNNFKGQKIKKGQVFLLSLSIDYYLVLLIFLPIYLLSPIVPEKIHILYKTIYTYLSVCILILLVPIIVLGVINIFSKKRNFEK